MRQMGIEAARFGATCRAFRKALGLSVLAQRSACEPRRPSNRQQGLAGFGAPTHVLVGRQTATAAVAAHGDLGLTPAVGAQTLSGASAVSDGKAWQTSQASMDTGEPTLQDLAQIEEEMPPVGDLKSRRSAQVAACGLASEDDTFHNSA
jgi:hypothetical protein